MAEILYRNDEHKFSVYRLSDIPDGVPRSGQADVEAWRAGLWRGWVKQWGPNWLSSCTEKSPFIRTESACCAVLDEHAGPLLGQKPAFTITVMPYSYSVSIPAGDFYAELTKDLGAQWGECPGRHGCGMRTQDRKHWSAHLRFLVARSDQERRSREPSVGWDPYGDDI